MTTDSNTKNLQDRIDFLEGALAYALGAIAALQARRPDAERLKGESTTHGSYAAYEIFGHRDQPKSQAANDGYVSAQLWAKDPMRLKRIADQNSHEESE